MILIADSGSTKTDWALIAPSGVHRYNTKGLNPFFMSSQQMSQEIGEGLVPSLPCRADVRSIYFYGAGCTPQKSPDVIAALERHFPSADCFVTSDMLGAARALSGRESGIVCILGTGANSCLYDGSEIVMNVSPLGFILGDEGSGAVLGKNFIGALLKNQLPAGLKEEFLRHYSLTPEEIIDKVYRQPFPNRFLASFAPFLCEHLSLQEVRELVRCAFDLFLVRNVRQYPGVDSLPIHFVGSVAFYFREVLCEALASHGWHMGNILRTPIDGLLDYHTSH